MILAGDVGATKTNLALFEVVGDTLIMQNQQQFSSREFSNLNEVIIAFGKETSTLTIDAACFGIAGPIIKEGCHTTNLPWKITSSQLQEYLGTHKVRLLNDLEATAYGMLHLPEDDFIDLNPSGENTEGNRAVIAAGTGLGEAMLYYDGTDYHPIGSEGGHSDFAPVTEQQDALLQWMRNRYGEHVSYERILSGPGIYALYEFLHESGFAPQPDSMIHLPQNKDRSAMITECALTQNDPLCMASLRLFTEIYAAEAGNLALKTMSLGGLYIGGGIAPKILPIITGRHFMHSFSNKGRFEGLLRNIQVKIALNPDAALLGAAHFAVDKL